MLFTTHREPEEYTSRVSSNEVIVAFSYHSKGHGKLKNTELCTIIRQPGGVGTPTQCISYSQSEIFHPAEDPSYFQECRF